MLADYLFWFLLPRATNRIDRKVPVPQVKVSSHEPRPRPEPSLDFATVDFATVDHPALPFLSNRDG